MNHEKFLIQKSINFSAFHLCILHRRLQNRLFRKTWNPQNSPHINTVRRISIPQATRTKKIMQNHENTFGQKYSAIIKSHYFSGRFFFFNSAPHFQQKLKCTKFISLQFLHGEKSSSPQCEQKLGNVEVFVTEGIYECSHEGQTFIVYERSAAASAIFLLRSSEDKSACSCFSRT